MSTILEVWDIHEQNNQLFIDKKFFKKILYSLDISSSVSNSFIYVHFGHYFY